jgi:hypothetical protein
VNEIEDDNRSRRTAIKHTQLINNAFKIMLQNGSLWIVTVITIGTVTVVQTLLGQAGIAFAILTSLLAFTYTAFLPGALIHLVNAIAERHSVTVQDGFNAAIRNLLRLLGLRVILLLPVWIISFLATRTYASAMGQAAGTGELQSSAAYTQSGILLGIRCFISLLTIFSGAISVGADRAVILEGMIVFDALKRGVRILLDKLKDFIVIGFLLGLVIVVPAVFLTCCLSSSIIPLSLQNNAFPDLGNVLRSFHNDPFSNLPILAINVAISIFFESLVQILSSSAWTLAFRYWQGMDPIVPQDQPEITVVE